MKPDVGDILNTRSELHKEFKGFLFQIKEYKTLFTRDIQELLNERSSPNDIIRKLFTKKLTPISGYYFLLYKYPKETQKIMKESLVTYDILYRIDKLKDFLNIDEEYLKKEFNRLSSF